jgi:sugar lactone lactonase YvrE
VPALGRARLRFAGDADVGESPVWDPRDAVLYSVDLLRGTIHLDRTDADRESFSTGVVVGAIARTRAAGRLVVAAHDGFGYWDRTNGLEILEAVIDPAALRMNDAKVDPAGRIWAGSTAHDFEAGAGALHWWDGTRSRTVLGGLTLPNGIGWSPDGRTLYLVDSIPGVLMAYEYDAATASVSGGIRIFRTDRGVPDGLAIDGEGCIWLALWGAGEVLRLAPNGAPLARITVPATQPSSCAFGDEGDLFITSATRGLDAATLAGEPGAGGIYSFRTQVAGAPLTEFPACL